MVRALAIAAAAALLLCPTGGSAAGTYMVTRIGMPAAYTGRWVAGLNSSGKVVGFLSSASGSTVAFDWDDNAGVRTLGTTQYPRSQAFAVNDLGQVAGWSAASGSQGHASIWSPAGHMVDIGTLGGTSSYGYGINNQGEVVGASFTANGQNRAFRWDLLGGMTDLGTLGGILDHTSVANHINDFGQVVGTSYGQGNDYHGFFWEDGLMLDVGVLSGDACSAAQAINNSGEVVGRCGGNRPFIWDSTHGIRALDSGGAVMAGASDINNMSLVVGHIRPTDDSEQRAVLWEGGVMTELDSLIPPSSGWKLSGAEAVNDLGWIAGIGTYEGELCGFLLTPVPEPSSLLALLCGVAGVVWRRRR